VNDDPGSAGHWIQILVLIAGALLSFLMAGSISALVTIARMQKDGLIGSDQSPPAPGLLRRSRPLLLSLSIAYLVATASAAAAWPACVAPVVGGQGVWLWIVAWVVFFALILLGSMLTKALALSRPLGFTVAAQWLLWPVYALLRPFTWSLQKGLAKLVPSVWALDLAPPLSGGEIRGLLADEEASEFLEDQEVDWARSIFELGDTELREIMVPRVDMAGLDVSTSFEEATQFAANSRFTRLPVWDGSQDRILGILHTKDLLAAQARGESPPVRQLLRPIHFLPESKKIDDALREFREGRIHLAVVVDEYGGTAGIVTLEDVLEEIVGEIRDEFDEEGELVRRLDDRSAVVDPRIDLDDLNELFEWNLPTEDSDTLGGLLYSLCGRVPVRGDTVEYEGLKFTIDRVERQRIRQVTVRAETSFPPEGNGSAAVGGSS
jgi:putative hemolysin